MNDDYDNTNRFTLSRNENRKSDKHAEFNGTLNVEGREFWMDAWVKEGKRGRFFSGSVKLKDRKPPAPEPDSIDDEIPF